MVGGGNICKLEAIWVVHLKDQITIIWCILGTRTNIGGVVDTTLTFFATTRSTHFYPNKHLSMWSICTNKV